ncbi:hypothetical protein ACOZ4I_07550 [Haloarcula salina]|uniref:hypothetical protein n=1 Tax=Haloarcula salina TaxID=1429914 RepID=UPI003C6F3D7D
MVEKTRRTYLGSILSAASIAVAGCNSGQGSEPSDGTTTSTNQPKQSSPFSGFEFEGFDLKVELKTTNGFDKVAVFGPSGEEFVSSDVTTGAEQVSLDFEGYTAGEHRIVALDTGESEIVAETTQDFTPNLELERFVTPSPDEIETAETHYSQFTIDVINRGTAPVKITWTAMDGKTVSDSFDSGYVKKNEHGTGISFKGKQYPILVPIDDTVTLSSDNSVLSSGYGFSNLPPEEMAANIQLFIGTRFGESVYERQVVFKNTTGQTVVEQSDAEVLIKREGDS